MKRADWKIEVSLLEAAANLQCVRMMQNYLQGDLPVTVTAPAGNFACSDGYLFVIVLRQADFDTACGVLGLDDMVNNARYACRRAASAYGRGDRAMC